MNYSQAKAQVQFNTQYIIGGRKNLANTFGLFQLGREILISGHITGYEHAQFMWIVTVSNSSTHILQEHELIHYFAS
jgi:hypothetical protein